MADDIPHPRDSFSLIGAQAQEQAFAAALARGRLHHAWMLTGPEGVGKASFAYRAARRLLGAAPAGRSPLDASAEDPVSRQVSARSHPDLIVLERLGADGKLRRTIPVDEARRLPEFFAKAPARSPYRVAIIDAADDLNAAAANAVLKTLEEPPERGVLFLVCHAPGALLPTIRSRCRRLAFSPLPVEEAARLVADRASLPMDQATMLADMAGGAPGQAWRLAATGAIDIDHAAMVLLAALPETDDAALLGMAEGFRGDAGAQRFALLFQRLAERVRLRALALAQDGQARAAETWARVWSRLASLPGEVEAVNLDRADAFWTAVGELRAAART